MYGVLAPVLQHCKSEEIAAICVREFNKFKVWCNISTIFECILENSKNLKFGAISQQNLKFGTISQQFLKFGAISQQFLKFSTISQQNLKFGAISQQFSRAYLKIALRPLFSASGQSMQGGDLYTF